MGHWGPARPGSPPPAPRVCAHSPTPTGGEPVEFFVEAAANPIPPWLLADWPLLLPDYSGPPLYVLETAELAVADRSVEGLWLDMQIPAELVALDAERSEEIVVKSWTRHGPLSNPRTSPALGTPGPGACYSFLDPGPTSSANTVVAVGHAHIDCASGCGRCQTRAQVRQDLLQPVAAARKAIPSTTSPRAARPCSTSG